MVKKRNTRNKKFWSGIFMSGIGLITLAISYTSFNYLVVDSWLWSMSQEIGGIGMPILIIGVALVVFNKDVKDVVA